jgi:hypothetical protein
LCLAAVLVVMLTAVLMVVITGVLVTLAAVLVLLTVGRDSILAAWWRFL